MKLKNLFMLTGTLPGRNVRFKEAGRLLPNAWLAASRMKGWQDRWRHRKISPTEPLRAQCNDCRKEEPMKHVELMQTGEKCRPEQIRRYRKSRKENQTEFWQRFGVTQSRGSRFELGMALPDSVAILVRLYLDGTITDRDLHRARRSQSDHGVASALQQPVPAQPLAA